MSVEGAPGVELGTRAMVCGCVILASITNDNILSSSSREPFEHRGHALHSH